MGKRKTGVVDVGFKRVRASVEMSAEGWRRLDLLRARLAATPWQRPPSRGEVVEALVRSAVGHGGDHQGAPGETPISEGPTNGSEGGS